MKKLITFILISTLLVLNSCSEEQPKDKITGKVIRKEINKFKKSYLFVRDSIGIQHKTLTNKEGYESTKINETITVFYKKDAHKYVYFK